MGLTLCSLHRTPSFYSGQESPGHDAISGGLLRSLRLQMTLGHQGLPLQTLCLWRPVIHVQRCPTHSADGPQGTLAQRDDTHSCCVYDGEWLWRAGRLVSAPEGRASRLSSALALTQRSSTSKSLVISSGHGADEREARTGFLGKCLWAGVRAACISPTYSGRIFQVVKQLGQEQVCVHACVCVMGRTQRTASSWRL